MNYCLNFTQNFMSQTCCCFFDCFFFNCTNSNQMETTQWPGLERRQDQHKINKCEVKEFYNIFEEKYGCEHG